MKRAVEPEFLTRVSGDLCSSKVIALRKMACTKVTMKNMLKKGAMVLGLLFAISPTPAAETLPSDPDLSGIVQVLGQPRADCATAAEPDGTDVEHADGLGAVPVTDRAPLPAAAVALEPKDAGKPLSRPAANLGRYIIETWQTEHGLPQTTVTSIAQTRDGYLWVGTLNGLARFDGVHFKVFSAASTPELGSARIKYLFGDREGGLWISLLKGGVVRLQDGRFTRVALPESAAGAPLGIDTILEDETGGMLLKAEDHRVIRWADGQYLVASTNWPPDAMSGSSMREDAQGRLWLSTAEWLYRLEGGRLRPMLKGKELHAQNLFHSPSRSGGYWITTQDQVGLWRDGQGFAAAGATAWVTRELLHGIEDGEGQLWLATQGRGLLCYRTNGPMQQFTTKEGLGSDFVRQIFADAEGDVWVGTDSGGLNRLRRALFKVYAAAQGLTSDRVTSVCEGPEGDVWVGTDGNGVNRLRWDVASLADRTPEAGLVRVGALLADRQGRIWMSGRTGGISWWQGDRFGRIGGFASTNAATFGLFEDSRDGIWLGQENTTRIVRLSGETNSVLDLPKPMPPVNIRCLAEDAAGGMWFGTDGSGLLRWQHGRWTHFTRHDGLGSDFVWSLHVEPKGCLWIGTAGGGLCRFKDGKLATCTTRQGLLNDVICHIADDGRGNFWFGSHRGVFRASQAELNQFADGALVRIECVPYGKSDGLPALECAGGFQPAGCKTRDGRLWFPTVKGLAVVDPAVVATSSVVPPVYLEELIVDGQTVNLPDTGLKASRQTATTSSLQIGPGHRRYEFRYTGLSFSAPEGVRFRTRLEGLDQEWTEAGTSRVASYSRLPPGRYTFKVRACNRDGVWNQTGASLAFTVMPFFWQTGWFLWVSFGGFATVVGGAAWFVARRRDQRRIERLERITALEQERSRIARDIHDDLGANLTRIAWLSELADTDKAMPDRVEAHSRKISGYARQMVRSLDEIVWAVNPRNDTLQSLAQYLTYHAHEYFDPTAVNCRLEIPSDLPAMSLPSETRHDLFLALKEALNNVLKHAAASEARIRLSIVDTVLTLAVEDNGRGFDPAALPPGRPGHGLENLRQRIEGLGGQFQCESAPGRGTRLTFTLKLPDLA